MKKTLTITIEMQANNTPQNFKFEGGVSGIEALAIWTIAENFCKMQKEKMLNLK